MPGWQADSCRASGPGAPLRSSRARVVALDGSDRLRWLQTHLGNPCSILPSPGAPREWGGSGLDFTFLAPAWLGFDAFDSEQKVGLAVRNVYDCVSTHCLKFFIVGEHARSSAVDTWSFARFANAQETSGVGDAVWGPRAARAGAGDLDGGAHNGKLAIQTPEYRPVCVKGGAGGRRR